MNKSKADKAKVIRKNIFNDNPDKKIKQDKAEIASIAYEKKIEEVYGYIKQGMRSNEIYAMLILDEPELTEGKFVNIITDAYIYSETAIQKDREYVFQLHMNRYEDIYEKCMSAVEGYKKPESAQDWNQWRVMVTKYSQALSALNHKEDLLGLHDKRMVLEFGDNKAVIVEKEEKRGADGIPGYDLENLTLEEQVELLGLIKEARTVPIEGIQRVVVKTTTIEINGERTQHIQNIDQVETTHDIEFEEMPPNVVSKMTNVERIEEVEEVEVDPIKDEIDRKNFPVPKTAVEIANKMQEDIMKKFKEKLKKNKPK